MQGQASRPERAQLFDAAVESVTSKRGGVDQNQVVDEILDTLVGSPATSESSVLRTAQTVLLAKEVYPNLTGRVHAQAAPSTAYDTDGTVAHAKRLVAIFAENGIPKYVLLRIALGPAS